MRANTSFDQQRVLSSQKPTKVRISILLMIFICVIINYMDRANISIAGPHLATDLGLNSVELGLVFSAFGWAYCILQIPGGLVIDKLGTRLTYTLSLILWSIVTLLQSIATGFGSMFGLRLSVGAFEAPAYPTNNRVITSWFPDNERASAIGFYTSGQFVGLAFLAPILTTIQNYFGWRTLFIITGLVGIVWGIIWFFIYRDPLKHKRVNQQELDYLRENGAVIEKTSDDPKAILGPKKKMTFRQASVVFTSRKLWGIYIGQFAVGTTLWFFLTWFPTYLVDYRHLDFIKSGFLSSIPYLAAFVGVIVSGIVSDRMMKHGVNPSIARKMPIILGLLLSTTIIGANFTDNTALIMFFMTLAFFGNGVASITWVFVSALAPKELLGLAGGTFNFIGGLPAIIIPIVIGLLVQGGNFAPALIFIASITVIGALSYIFLVGKVERVSSKL